MEAVASAVRETTLKSYKKFFRLLTDRLGCLAMMFGLFETVLEPKSYELLGQVSQQISQKTALLKTEIESLEARLANLQTTQNPPPDLDQYEGLVRLNIALRCAHKVGV